jgi:serine/threonine protein kinase
MNNAARTELPLPLGEGGVRANAACAIGSASNRTPDERISTDRRLAQILDRCLADMQSGRPLDREALLAEHADIAADLAGCLDSLQFVQAFQDSCTGSAGDPHGGHVAPRHETSEALGGTAGLSSSAEFPLPLSEGEARTLGDFRILREIGRGGMGIVYEAEQLSLNRRVALKVLPFASMLDPRHLQRFKNEALAAAHLDHPNIVEVYGVGCERGIHFYAMRYVEGQTLAAVVDGLKCVMRSSECGVKQDGEDADLAGTPNSEFRTPNSIDTAAIAALSTLRTEKPREFFRTVAELGIQAAEALEHAHQMGIVHRDIKPSNLMVEVRNAEFGVRSERHFEFPSLQPLASSLRLFITDFGLAHIESDLGAAALTMTGDLVGTLRYMSPEQAEGRSAILDHRSDIYSLGITLYELLTLRPAFPASDRQTLVKQITQDEPPAPRKLNKHIPGDLETIVLKAIAKEPRDRYTSARHMADDLRRFGSEEPVRARRPTLLHRLRNWGHRHFDLVATAAVLGMFLLIAAIAATSTAWRLGEKSHELELANQRIADQRDSLEEVLFRVVAQNRFSDALHAPGSEQNYHTRIEYAESALARAPSSGVIHFLCATALSDGLVFAHAIPVYHQPSSACGLTTTPSD